MEQRLVAPEWSAATTGERRAKALLPHADPSIRIPMTSRPLHISFTAFAVLLFQALAIFGTARGLVYCVGPAGHLAIEDNDAARRCRESSAGLGADLSGGTPVVNGHPVCVDTPLSAQVLNRAVSLAMTHDFVVAALSVAGFESARPLVVRLTRTPALPSPNARSLRSVVLLI